MKTTLRLAMLSLLIVLTPACTTMDERSSALPAMDRSEMTKEELYMARVEQIARRRGIEVIWVHRPKFDGQLVASTDD